MGITLTALFLHGTGIDAVLELLAMVIPFAAILGFGIYLIIPPIVRAQGEQYQYRGFEGDSDLDDHRLNGNGHRSAVERKNRTVKRRAARSRRLPSK